MTMTNEQKSVLLTRIELIERELAEIKQKLLTDDHPPAVKLEGLWADIDVTEEDIEDARHAVFRDVDDI
jgi:hypothetical protein